MFIVKKIKKRSVKRFNAIATIKSFLEEKRGKFFSIEEVTKELNIGSEQTVKNWLFHLLSKGEIVSKKIHLKGTKPCICFGSKINPNLELCSTEAYNAKLGFGNNDINIIFQLHPQSSSLNDLNLMVRKNRG
jgi:hypothetical protein